MDDKALPGWSVVLKKEARGRRITSTEMEHCLGQEESSGDLDAFPDLQRDRIQSEEENDFVSDTMMGRTVRRRRAL